MAKLYLKSDHELLKKVPLSQGTITIGRLPNNTLQIEDSAVSGHHCRIRWEVDHYLIEDNDSLNGIYINGEQVFKATLKDGDDILVGKHFLRFEDEINSSAHVAEPKAALIPEPQQPPAVVHQEAKPAPAAVAVADATTLLKPAGERVGVLASSDGKTDESRYVLTGKLTMIGKSDMATIRLKGWFAPKVAANLMRRDAKYLIASADKDVKISINGQPVTGQHELNDGDAVDVAGFKFQFSIQE